MREERGLHSRTTMNGRATKWKPLPGLPWQIRDAFGAIIALAASFATLPPTGVARYAIGAYRAIAA